MSLSLKNVKKEHRALTSGEIKLIYDSLLFTK